MIRCLIKFDLDSFEVDNPPVKPFIVFPNGYRIEKLYIGGCHGSIDVSLSLIKIWISSTMGARSILIVFNPPKSGHDTNYLAMVQGSPMKRVSVTDCNVESPKITKSEDRRGYRW